MLYTFLRYVYWRNCKRYGNWYKAASCTQRLFGAEPWTEHQRQELEAILNIKAYDIYGLSEIAGPGVAFECPAQQGMHINEDFFYPEIINPDTEEVLPDGEFGELVFTCTVKKHYP